MYLSGASFERSKRNHASWFWSRANSIQPRTIEEIAETALLVSTVTFQPHCTLPDLKGAVKVKTLNFRCTCYDRKLKTFYGETKISTNKNIPLYGIVLDLYEIEIQVTLLVTCASCACSVNLNNTRWLVYCTFLVPVIWCNWYDDFYSVLCIVFVVQSSLQKPQVTLAATFRLPLSTKQQSTTSSATSALRTQLTSPLHQATSAGAMSSSSMPSVSVGNSTSGDGGLSGHFDLGSGLQSPSAVSGHSMPTLTPMGSERSLGQLSGNTNANNSKKNSTLTSLIMNTPRINKLDWNCIICVQLYTCTCTIVGLCDTSNWLWFLLSSLNIIN